MKIKFLLVLAVSIPLMFTGCDDTTKKAENVDPNIVNNENANTKIVDVESEPEVDYRALLENSSDKMSKLSSYDLDGHIDSKLEIYGVEQAVTITIKSTVIQEPLKSKTETTTTISSQGETKSEIYLEKIDDTVMIYMNNNGTWSKQEANDELVESLLIDPNDTAKVFIENLKEIKKIGEEQVDGKDAVILEITSDSKIFEQVSGALTQNLNLPAEYLLNIGDLTYKVWITNDGIIKQSFDLTDCFNALGDAILADANASDLLKEQASMFKSTSMYTEFKFSKLNAVDDFEIPAEARE